MLHQTASVSAFGRSSIGSNPKNVSAVEMNGTVIGWVCNTRSAVWPSASVCRVASTKSSDRRARSGWKLALSGGGD